MAEIAFSGVGHNVEPGHRLGFAWGAVLGGPYPNLSGTVASGTLTPSQPYSFNATGLPDASTLYVIATVRDIYGILRKQSSELVFTTP